MAGKGMQIRGGTRGGQDQFDWEDVKVDKHRENYLGHSVKASVGRWQKGKDLSWYTKHSKVAGHTERLREEVAAIKRAEEEAMAAALGLKPPAPVKPQQALTQQELSEVCRRRSKDEVEGAGGDDERIKGVGYQSRRAQSMFMGSKSTTTKEGATIFEHDALVKDDGRLRMPESRKKSQSDVTSPTTEAPVNLNESSMSERGPEVATPTLTTPTLTVSSFHSVPDSKKVKKKKKKSKKHKEKRDQNQRSDQFSGSSSESDSKKSRRRAKREKRSKKKRRRDSSSDSSADEWAEKQPSHPKTRRRSPSPPPRARVRSKRYRERSSSSSSSSGSEDYRAKKHRDSHKDKHHSHRYNEDRTHKRQYRREHHRT